MMKNCYCDSNLLFEACCQPLLAGKEKAKSALALMRSRYTAFVMGNLEYLKMTMNKPFSDDHLYPYQWIKLEIVGQSDLFHVEFKAFYIYRHKLRVLHEKSSFILTDGNWLYLDGILLDTDNQTRVISLNASCPCGSGKKYKNCHLS